MNAFFIRILRLISYRNQSLLTLTLFVLGVNTYYHNATLALDDLTFLANGLNGRSYFHVKYLLDRTTRPI